MGTFDSVYLNKIRRLEEENRQLRKLIEAPHQDDPAYPHQDDPARPAEDYDRHSDELQAHLDNAEKHRGTSGVSDKAGPHIERANLLINAGHGSSAQLDQHFNLVRDVPMHTFDMNSDLHALRRDIRTNS